MEPCPRCGQILKRQTYPMEKSPDHLSSEGRHKWLTYWHCSQCGHQCTELPRREYEAEKARRQAAGAGQKMGKLIYR